MRHSTSAMPAPVLSRCATGAALFCVGLATSAHAVVVVEGSYNVYPVSMPVGPGNTDLGSNTLQLGSGVGAVGSLRVDGGSQFAAASIRFADGTGAASGVIDGAGTRLALTGGGNTNRLELGAWGQGTLTVSGGATLDGRANSADCRTGAQFCHNFIGNGAGSQATLTVTGAGSNASFLRSFVVGGLAVFRPPIETFTFGTPGASTTGIVNVLDGGLLTTDYASLGVAPGGTSPLGSERSFAYVTISGAGSRWNVTGGTVDGNTASISTAQHANATASITLSNGGVLNVQPVAGTNHAVSLSTGAGKTDMVVTGVGSAVNMNAGVFQVGRGLNGSARLDVLDGGAINDSYYFVVGRGGSNGRLVVDGAGSRVTVNRSNTIGSDAGFFDVGRDGGIGQADITNGGRVEVISGTVAGERARNVRLGVGAASQGTLNITGAASRLLMDTSSAVPGGGATEALNPYFAVGYQGVGYLNVSGGAKLLMNGGAVSTVADTRQTSFIVGGRDDTNTGGQGFATITGAGTELRLSGSDSIIWVGRGPGSTGQMTVNNGAAAAATNLLVGRVGGAVGLMTIDNAAVNLSGQQTGSSLAGAAAVIGSGVGSTGVLNMNNGAQLHISNPGGSVGVSFNVGGSSTASGGDGVLQMNGGSRIRLSGGPAGSAAVNIGREGAAFARLRGASVLDAGDGSLYVGRFTGSDGTLVVSENSSVTAGWVGVGRNRTAGGSVDGGTGTFILSGGTLNAVDVVIGTNGFLGGTAGSINVSGSVTNYGIFSPGNSPGRFTINGNYVAGTGSRLVLEVQKEADGSYSVDEVLFGASGSIDLAALRVEFRFLGSTDPTEFRDSGRFDIDSFVRQADAAGAFHGLADAAYNGVQFSAVADAYVISSFSYSASTGATFTATPVPEEPAGWALGLAGGVTLAALARRRQPGARTSGCAGWA